MTAQPTRVAHILGSLEYAGLQRTVLALIRQLPAYAHTVIVNSSNRGPMHEEFSSVSQVIPCSYKRGSLVDGARYLPRLVTTLRECETQVVLAHLFGNHALVSLAGWRAGVSAIYGVSANDPVHYAGSRWQPMALAQLARPFCRGEIAVSNSVARVLRSALLLPARRVHVVPNGLAVEEISARADAGRIGTIDAAFDHHLLMVAWIARAKDHETAIRALAALRRRGLSVCLRFAGGAYRQARQVRLEELAATLGVSGAVQFLGIRDDIPELMGASDVVVHATHSEGLPITILEAFAARTPVVASDIPACREALDGGQCGLLVPPRDHVAMADAIELLLRNPGRGLALADQAFNRVQEHYHTKHMAAGYAKLIEAAVAS